jgi:dihydroorotate dehydrogenase
MEEAGGLSGAPLWDLSQARIGQILEASSDRLPVIGVGGVRTGEQAERLLEMGCKAVQVYSGLIFEGPGLAHRINRHLLRKTSLRG